MAFYPSDWARVAREEIGYHEKASALNLDSKTANSGANNYTKYARDLDKIKYFNTLKQGFDWCAVLFNWDVWKAVGKDADKARAVNQRPINPFGDIVYYGSTAAVEADANVGAASLWQEYTMTFGYAFNRTGAALVMPYPSPIYIKCAPQSDGSAIIDADNPYVFNLPSTDDGKIYIYLGRTYSATQIEIVMTHPVYYYKGGAVRLWTNLPIYAGGVT